MVDDDDDDAWSNPSKLVEASPSLPTTCFWLPHSLHCATLNCNVPPFCSTAPHFPLHCSSALYAASTHCSFIHENTWCCELMLHCISLHCMYTPCNTSLHAYYSTSTSASTSTYYQMALHLKCIATSASHWNLQIYNFSLNYVAHISVLTLYTWPCRNFCAQKIAE